jgi:transporter family-2 protein
VTCAAAFAPRLGAGSFIVLVVAGQMITAIVVDHFGLMALTPKPVTLARVLGVALIMTGAIFIQFSKE